MVTFFSLLLLCRTLGQNADNERNYDVENDVNLAKSLQQYLKYLRILSQSASKNLYPRKASDKASVKVVVGFWCGSYILWFWLPFSLSSNFWNFPSVSRPDIVFYCLLQLIIISAQSFLNINHLQHCKCFSSSNLEHFTLIRDGLHVMKKEEWDKGGNIFTGWFETRLTASEPLTLAELPCELLLVFMLLRLKLI